MPSFFFPIQSSWALFLYAYSTVSFMLRAFLNFVRHGGEAVLCFIIYSLPITISVHSGGHIVSVYGRFCDLQ
jgi:hypothetical protein